MHYIALRKLTTMSGVIQPNQQIPDKEISKWNLHVVKAHLNMGYIKEVIDEPVKPPVLTSPTIVQETPQIPTVTTAAPPGADSLLPGGVKVKKGADAPPSSDVTEWNCWKCTHEPFKSSRALKVHMNRTHKESKGA